MAGTRAGNIDVRVQAQPAVPCRAPAYLHLLWEHELGELEPILRAIAEHRSQVLAHWHRLYIVHFGDQRTLSEGEFLQIYGQDLEVTTRNLRGKDMARFAADIRGLGEALAERRVPFPEVVASIHLFEESAHTVFPEHLRSPALYFAFDKLSHCRIIVLSDAYFRFPAASAAARLRDLEREAAQLPHGDRRRFHGLVGGNPAMQTLYEHIEAVAATRGTVFLVGESGTGKELAARAIHECGALSPEPFVALNCAALPR
ncbi:MAG: sigma 54-interacting transcriptional regulator, partial [Candidatus Binatia bacterium]